MPAAHEAKRPDAIAPGRFTAGEPDNVLLSREIHPTIIGAEAFHGPVRDGKEWVHLAMVVRQRGTTDLWNLKDTDKAIQLGRSKLHEGEAGCDAQLLSLENEAARLWNQAARAISNG